MQTSLLTNPQTGSASAASPLASVLGNAPSDVFMKLLVAQVKNQNPLEPTDPSQFVNQLTQLSQMESLQKLASQASANATMMESLQTLALGAQVGSQVRVRSDRVTLAGEPVQGGFTLQNANAQVTLVLIGPDGSERRVPLGTHEAGAAQFTIDPVKLGLPAGTYGLRVETSSEETPAVEVAGKLSGIKLSASGGVVIDVLNVGELPVTSITQINGSQA